MSEDLTDGVRSEAMAIPALTSCRNSESRLNKLLSQSPDFRELVKEENMPDTPSRVDDASIFRKLLRNPSSIDINESLCLDLKNESKVLVLYTGGTIGMVRNKEGVLAPQPHAMEDKIRSTITMHDEEYSKLRFKQTMAKLSREQRKDILFPLVLPEVPNHKRVIYTIYEYDPLLDSSNMTMDDWLQISRDIDDCYKLFDGFVVLHGTDTLAYTASALSFMLENLGKPVIITGSQIPCFETRSDGRDNFVGALILAGNYNIPEVGVYFRHQLMRGNRTIKISSGDLNAFTSPNMSPLVKAGIDIDVDYKAIHRPQAIEKFKVHTKLNRNVVMLRMFPSIRSDTVAHFLKDPIEGVVLQCYGAGNMPSNRRDIMDAIGEAAARGVLIVSVTQCTHGGVKGLYETGKALLDKGVIPGCDMTPEAALTKLSYVLSKDEWTLEEKRQKMMTNLMGEMTVLKSGLEPDAEKEGELELVQAVAKALHLTTSDELKRVKNVLFPSILCSAVYINNLATLKEMQSMGADLAIADYDMRTPLHVASSEGNLEIVEFLLKNGASVHVRDRSEDSPLKCAIDGGHEEVIKLLVNCGAHLQAGLKEMGEVLCFLARQGDVAKLRCYELAGVNLNLTNLSMNTPLHMAVETGQIEVVQYLIGLKNIKLNAQNVYGQTPKGIAQTLRRFEILDILKKAYGEDIPM